MEKAGQSGSVNPRVHGAAVKMRFGGAKREVGLTAARGEWVRSILLFPPRFQGSMVSRGDPGFRRSRSTVSYVPAAASRMQFFGFPPRASHSNGT